MAHDGPSGHRLSLDTLGSSPTQQYGYYHQPQSPGGYSTPTSATFSTGQSSPRFSAQAPSSLSRSTFYNGSRAPTARRLSVPSAPVYQTAQPNLYQPAYFAPIPSGTAATFSNTSSTMVSPTSSVFYGRRESEAELDWRRRTWHPGTYANYVSRPATSGLTYQQTPDDSRPTMAPQSAASQITRLPGIESFGQVPPPPAIAPPPRLSSPMQVDNGSRPPVYPGPVENAASGPSDRRSDLSWDAGLHQNLNRLEIANTTPRKHSRSYADQIVSQQHPADHLSAPRPPPNFSKPHPLIGAPLPPPSSSIGMVTALDAEARGARDIRYAGAPHPSGSRPIMIAQRTSSADSASSDGVPTPSTSHGTEMHPAIMHPSGYIEMQRPGQSLSEEQHRALQAQAYAKPEPTRVDSGSHVYATTPGTANATYVLQAGREQQLYPMYPPPARPEHDMNRLEALVAVATSEKAQSRN